jgi:YHS domain-containing protein
MSKFAASALAALLLAAAALAAPPEAAPPTAAPPGHDSPAGVVRLSCPVLKAHVDSEMKAIPVRVNGLTAYACSDVALDLFKKEPAKYLKEAVPDPVTGKSFRPTAKTPKVVRGNAVFLFVSPETKATFLSDPEKYSKPRLP